MTQAIGLPATAEAGPGRQFESRLHFLRSERRVALLLLVANFPYLLWWLWHLFKFAPRERLPRARSSWWILMPVYGFVVVWRTVGDLVDKEREFDWGGDHFSEGHLVVHPLVRLRRKRRFPRLARCRCCGGQRSLRGDLRLQGADKRQQLPSREVPGRDDAWVDSRRGHSDDTRRSAVGPRGGRCSSALLVALCQRQRGDRHRQPRACLGGWDAG